MSVRSWRRVALIALTVFAVSAAARPVPRAEAASPLMFGARTFERPGQTSTQAVQAFEAAVGRKLDVVRIFKLWNNSFPDAHANWLADTGHTVMVSVRSRKTTGNISWSAIANAQPGSALYNDMVGWANKVKAYRGQVYFAFHHEPEAVESLPYGNASDFRAAWRKFVGIMKAQGVSNAKYVWIMTDWSFWVGASDRRQAIKWYPGDTFVDAIAADAYNWHKCRGRNERWWSLEDNLKALVWFGGAHPREELWLAEWGSAEDPAVPGRKGEWFRDARATFKKPGWDQFRGIVYFNYPGEQNCYWPIDSSASATNAFRSLALDPFYDA